MNTFGERLRYARKSKGLTLVALAKRVDRKHPVIQNYESGRRGSKHPDARLVAQMCKELDITIDWLFYGDENK